MKNIIFTICMLILSILTGCNNTDNQLAECQDCDIANHSQQKLKVGEHTYNVRKYHKGSIDNPNFLTLNSSKKNISDIISFIGDDRFVNKDIRGLIVLFNTPGEIHTLEKEMIDAYIVYEQNNDAFNVRIFKKQGNSFQENELTNLSSNFISTNDFHNISLAINNNKVYKNIFAAIIFKGLKNKKHSLSELQNKISGISPLGKSSSYCYHPCPYPGPHAWCTAKESQNSGEGWWCAPDPTICFTDENEKIGEGEEEVSESISAYRAGNTRTFLHTVRDDYFAIENNGQKYIDIYYHLSRNIDYSNLNITFVNETFILINTLKPKLESLYDDRTASGIIVIDDETADLMKDYLNKYSYLFTDDLSQNYIQLLTEKINQFNNKSNNYITSNL